METSHIPVPRPRVPERCRRAPDAVPDRSFGIRLCNVRLGVCSYRGPVYVLGADGRQFECRRTEAA